jgi:hypothetical protein
MNDKSKGQEGYPQKTTLPTPQIALRSDLRAGADCSEGLQYWKSEYNYWKKLAKQYGCA